MAKSKNATMHNQNKKAHRIGIKKMKRITSQRGMDCKYLKNLRYAKAGQNKTSADKEARIEKQKADAAKAVEQAAARAAKEKAEREAAKQQAILDKAKKS